MSPKKEPDFFSYSALGKAHPLDSEPGERSLADDAATDAGLAEDFAKYESVVRQSGRSTSRRRGLGDLPG